MDSTIVSVPNISHESSTFVYEPLDDSNRSIRVIQVAPRSPGERIRIRIREVCMSTTLIYTCLSYMWGVATQDFEIIANDRTIRVRRNLYDFLDTAQKRYSERWLWVDALSINQRNVEERNYQVMRMGDIYRGAEEVIIWLGVRLETHCVFDVTAALGKRSGILPLNRATKYRSIMKADGNLERALDVGLSQLCDNLYWTRTWIIQEIISARELRIADGHGDCHDEDFRFVLHESYESKYRVGKSSLFSSHPHYCSHYSRFGDLRSKRSPNDLFSFWRLLDLVESSKCSDNRDHIYSILSLVEKGATFVVDYGSDVLSLFWQVTHHFGGWESSSSVALLCHALDLPIDKLRNTTESTMKFDITVRQHQMRRPWSLPPDLRQDEGCIPVFRTRSHALHEVLYDMRCKNEICQKEFAADDRDIIVLCFRHTDAYPMHRFTHYDEHVLIYSRGDGSLALRLFCICDRHAGEHRDLSGSALNRFVGESWEEVDPSETPEGLLKHNRYQLRLPIGHIFDSAECVEANIDAQRRRRDVS